MFAGLSVFGDSGFELSDTSGDDEHGAIGLRGSRNHVLDEIAVTGGVNNSDVELKKIFRTSTLVKNIRILLVNQDPRKKLKSQG